MKLGQFDIFPVTDGRFRLDGGAMFGVVPKALWERCCPADERNRVQLALRCLLVRAHGKTILVDTGVGNKWDAKTRDLFAIDRTPPLYDSLQAHGLSPDDVDLVVNTHLHFDHCGGNTATEDGRVGPAFKKARYVIQRGEFDDAVNANERTRASYRAENFGPLQDAHGWDLVEGDVELLPGIAVLVTGGHTAHHQAVKIESDGQVALFLGDLVPTVSHLPLPWIMGYDLYPLQTLQSKRWLLDQAYEQGWLLVFEHDPTVSMGYVKKDVDGKYFLEPVTN